jgi:murein L,D-transpeptidase YafK
MTLPLLASAVLSLVLGSADDSTRTKTKTRPDSLRAAASRSVTSKASPALVADSVVVEKAARRLTLFHRGEPVKIYFVALGRNPVGDKVQRGDLRTPEGLFSIEARNPVSKYYKALRISYPDVRHATRAAKLGVSAGGDIMIHGLASNIAKLGAGHRLKDWTEGCIAVTNEEIDEIYRAVPVGSPIEIKP